MIKNNKISLNYFVEKINKNLALLKNKINQNNNNNNITKIII